MAALLLTLYAFFTLWGSPLVSANTYVQGVSAKVGPDWPGWNGMQFMFVFGDSYSTTGWDVNGTQPNVTNPLGNPAFPGYTSSNGPNWVDFLTLTYNASYLETYNFAYGGATVDSALVAPYLPTVVSMKQQILSEFLPRYSPAPTGTPWTADNSLFAFFIGINDVNNSYQAQNKTLNGIILAEYASLIDTMYRAGARNFLFLLVPPVERSPGTQALGNTDIQLEAAAIADWNSRTALLASNVSSVYNDSSVFLFDYHQFFTTVLDTPTTYPQTSGYKNTTTYCADYENGTPQWNTSLPQCGIPVNQYLWLNTLHPTYPLHNASADQISQLLEGKTPTL